MASHRLMPSATASKSCLRGSFFFVLGYFAWGKTATQTMSWYLITFTSGRKKRRHRRTFSQTAVHGFVIRGRLPTVSGEATFQWPPPHFNAVWARIQLDEEKEGRHHSLAGSSRRSISVLAACQRCEKSLAQDDFLPSSFTPPPFHLVSHSIPLSHSLPLTVFHSLHLLHHSITGSTSVRRPVHAPRRSGAFSGTLPRPPDSLNSTSCLSLQVSVAPLSFKLVLLFVKFHSTQHSCQRFSELITPQLWASAVV